MTYELDASSVRIAYIKEKNASTHGLTRSTPHCFRVAKRHEASNFEISRNDRDPARPSSFDPRAEWRSCSCSEYIILVLHRGRPRPRTKRPGITKTTYIFSTQFQTLKGKRDLRLGPASIIPSTNTMLREGSPSCTRPCREVREGSRRYVGSGACVIKLFARHWVPQNEARCEGFPSLKIMRAGLSDALPPGQEALSGI